MSSRKRKHRGCPNCKRYDTYDMGTRSFCKDCGTTRLRGPTPPKQMGNHRPQPAILDVRYHGNVNRHTVSTLSARAAEARTSRKDKRRVLAIDVGFSSSTVLQAILLTQTIVHVSGVAYSKHPDLTITLDPNEYHEDSDQDK